MDHNDHLDLLRPGIVRPGGVWADFGSGRGAFTLALADLLGPGSTIYSIDKEGRALSEQARQLQSRFPGVTLYTIPADFSKPLDLPPLDGLLMANSLHFFRRKDKIIRLLKSYLNPAAPFLLVEYDTDRGNPWVPYPLSFPTWRKMASDNGFAHTKLLATKPSRFLGGIFSSVSW